MVDAINFHFKRPEESPGYLLWQVTMSWQRKIKKELDKLEITHTQFVLMAALAWLLKQRDTVTQVEIAKHSNTDRMMVSKVLRTLQKKGLITRKEHETDTRAKKISLTAAGSAILKQALFSVEKVDVEFFSVLGVEGKRFNANMAALIVQKD
ncbi:MAG TPA: MarR family transcriptional regulator [Bacteroidetes bacterium]|nr:MarR family transcriptional regulator [Bacteroidota bacterium]